MYIGYCRKSTAGQGECTFETQRDFLIRQAESLKEPYEILMETGSGSTIADRPVFMRILAELKPGTILGCYDQSRISRNSQESYIILEAIKEKQARLHVNGKFINPDDPQDMMIFGMGAVFATYQKDIQNKKAKEGRKIQYENGDAVFTSSLFGYELIKRGKHITINVIEEEAKIVRFIFTKYSEGWTTSRLEKELMGTPVPRGHILDMISVRRILSRPLYAGYYLRKSKLTKQIQHYTEDEIRPLLVKSNLYPPLITEELWWTVFRNWRKSHHKTRPFETRFSKAELTAVFVCPSCGKSMTYLSQFNRFKVPRAIYTLARHGAGCTMLNRTLYQAKWLERVMAVCFRIVFLEGGELNVFFKEKESELYENTKEIRSAIEAVDKSIGEIDRKISRLVQAVMEGALTLGDIKKERENLDKEKNTLVNRRNELEDSLMRFSIEAEEYLEIEAGKVLDEFDTNRRDLYLRFIREGKVYPKYLTAEFMNGKLFEIHRPTRGKPDDTPVKVFYKGEWQYSFILRPDSIEVSDVNSVEETREFVKRDYQHLLAKALISCQTQ